MQNEIK